MSDVPKPEQRFSREDLYSMAVYQKVILLCILCYLGAILAQFVLPPELRLFLGLGVVGLGLVATVFVFLLAIKLYQVGAGVVLGLLTLIPVIGLIVLLIVNGKATTALKEHGYRVGLLGADLSQFRQ